GGTAPYSVTLNGVTQVIAASGGSTTFTGLPAGTYTAHVVATGGCTKDKTDIVVSGPSAALSASSSNTAIKCNGDSSTVTVSASGGTAPYTGTGTFTRSAGTYSFTVTDANSCTATTTGNITQPSAAITASETTSPASCNGGTNGSVTVNVSGGTGPYSVTVNNVTHTGVTSSTTFSGLSAGTYPASITDANGCAGSATGTVGQPSPVTTSSSKTDGQCSGQLGSMTVNFSGGTPGYQCSLDGGAFA